VLSRATGGDVSAHWGFQSEARHPASRSSLPTPYLASIGSTTARSSHRAIRDVRPTSTPTTPPGLCDTRGADFSQFGRRQSSPLRGWSTVSTRERRDRMSANPGAGHGAGSLTPGRRHRGF